MVQFIKVTWIPHKKALKKGFLIWRGIYDRVI